MNYVQDVHWLKTSTSKTAMPKKTVPDVVFDLTYVHNMASLTRANLLCLKSYNEESLPSILRLKEANHLLKKTREGVF